MVFVKTWDESVPAGSRAANLGDDDIRDFKYAVRERLAIDHNFFSNEAGQSNVGAHNQASFLEQAADPAALADAIRLYAKLTGSYAELYSRHENAGVSQLTLNGKLWIAALTIASQARGDIIRGGASAFERLALGTLGKVLQSDGTDVVYDWLKTCPMSSFKNLKVIRPTTATVDVDADEVFVEDTNGNSFRAGSVNLTLDITASGANGLDTGAEAANTLYYIWVIRKSSDGTVAGLLSTATTIAGLTLPSGYDQAALVSCVGNNGSSNFIDFVQTGRRYNFKQWPELASGNVGAGGWTSIDLTPATLTFFVPSALSDFCYGSMVADSGQVWMTNDSSVSVGTYNRNIYHKGQSSAALQLFWNFDVLTADTLYWASNNSSSYLYLHGFILNKL